MLFENCFHFLQFDTEAANIDLAVISPRPFDVAVRQVPAQFAGSIEPIGRIAGKWIPKEPFVRKRLIADITFRQMGTAHIKFGQLADARELPCLIQQQELNIFDTPP